MVHNGIYEFSVGLKKRVVEWKGGGKGSGLFNSPLYRTGESPNKLTTEMYFVNQVNLNVQNIEHPFNSVLFLMDDQLLSIHLV